MAVGGADKLSTAYFLLRMNPNWVAYFNATRGREAVFEAVHDVLGRHRDEIFDKQAIQEAVAERLHALPIKEGISVPQPEESLYLSPSRMRGEPSGSDKSVARR